MTRPSVKKQIKRAIQKILPPSVSDWILSASLRRSFKKRFWKEQKYYRRRIYGDNGAIKILSGPFEGLKYFNRVVWGPLMPKWLGTYEEELHGIIHEICQAPYDTILDIGCAEGYYAVGLAKINPRAAVYAYDCDPFARKLCSELKEINQADNLSIYARCTHGEITGKAKGRTLILCDIEGFELPLLDPEKCPALKRTDLLVEIHPFEDKTEKEVADSLTQRFKPTHQIQCLAPQTRKASAYQDRFTLNPNELSVCLNEHREWDTPWLWMKATP